MPVGVVSAACDGVRRCVTASIRSVSVSKCEYFLGPPVRIVTCDVILSRHMGGGIFTHMY